MTHAFARAGFALSAIVLGATALPALAESRCSTDAFTVTGTPLSIEICAGPRAGKAPVIAIATLATRGGQAPVVRKIPLDIPADGDASHAIDDAPLQPLGIAGTLHMTIGYKGGTVRLEHALLVPGAIALK